MEIFTAQLRKAWRPDQFRRGVSIQFAGVYSILHNIHYPQKPLNSLVQASNGTFYGATAILASQDPKFVFSLSPGGQFQNIFQLTLNQGGPAVTNLQQLSDGNLWAAAENGGISAAGTIFTLTPGGSFLRCRLVV